QRHPGVQRAHVPVVREGRAARAGVRGLAFDRDVRVLGDVERVEPVLLGGLRGGGGRDAPVTGEEDDAMAHAADTSPKLERVLGSVAAARGPERASWAQG